MQFYENKLTNKFRAKTPKGFYDKDKGHTGVDYLVPVGTPVSLPLPLTFIGTLMQLEMGRTAYLKDAEGNIHVTSHLTTTLKKAGDPVAPGEVFAISGNTGRVSTAPHVHYEVISETPQEGLEFMTRELWNFKGFNVDPMPFLNKTKTPLKRFATQQAAKRALGDPSFAEKQRERRAKQHKFLTKNS